jgi:hypothetical protein
MTQPQIIHRVEDQSDEIFSIITAFGAYAAATLKRPDLPIPPRPGFVASITPSVFLDSTYEEKVVEWSLAIS